MNHLLGEVFDDQSRHGGGDAKRVIMFNFLHICHKVPHTDEFPRA